MNGLTPRRIIVAILSLALIAVALWQLRSAEQGITATRMTIGDIPATAYQLPGGGKAPAVVIAHGFAGSQQLMHAYPVVTHTH